MDSDQELGPDALGDQNARTRRGGHKFHRAYKACMKCRARKTRCNISAEDYNAGLPCARCRREMATCTFPVERHGTKPEQKRRSVSKRDGQSENRRKLNAAAGSPSANRHNNEFPRSTGHQRQPSRQNLLSPENSRQSGSSVPDQPIVLQDAVEAPNGHVYPTNVSDSMMRTVVSNGRDALDLLFEAAHHDRDDTVNDTTRNNNEQIDNNVRLSPTADARAGVASTSPAHSTLYGSIPNYCSMSVNLPADLVTVWKAYRFVRMGWLSAEEAITYVDLFFRNMAHLSPILDNFYADYSNHYWLVVREPMLCCMILTISSRYHVLPVSSGESRGFLIHQRLWDHCQHLLLRIMLGQEKGSKAKTRTMGSVEALLLLMEWQPRGLHGPPAADGWDSDIIFTEKDERDDNRTLVDSPSRGRWLEDVINPARRFDRMAWMAMGTATTLANELAIFDTEYVPEDVTAKLSVYEKRLRYRRGPLAIILHTYQEQLSSRLGRPSILSQTIIHGASVSKDFPGRIGSAWRSSIVGFTELTKLTKSVGDVLFPSSVVTKHLIQTGRYIGMIDHFTAQLSTWETKYLGNTDSNQHIRDIMTIEYEYVKIYANSLALQAVVERTLSTTGGLDQAPGSLELNAIDYAFVLTVIDGCLKILNIATKMAQQNVLRFAPVSVFLRITTASIFLLKGLGLGVNTTKLSEALGILTSAISALRESRPDDLHLGSRYATLLELHVVRLQAQFIPAIPPPNLTTRVSSISRQMQGDVDFDNQDWSAGFDSRMAGSFHPSTEEINAMDGDWLALPFDPSLIPFAPDDFRDFQGLGDTSMDFIWNLGP